MKKRVILLNLTCLAALFLVPGFLYSAKNESGKFQSMDTGRIQFEVLQEDNAGALPQYVLTDLSGKPIDGKKGIDNAGFHGFKITAGEGYRIIETHVALARGTQKVASFSTTSEILDTEQWRALCQPGDRLIIEVKKVVTTDKNQVVAVAGGIFLVAIH